MPRKPAGFTLLELVVVVCLVAILFSVALQRFLVYQEAAEKAAMESQIGALRSAQALQVAARILSGGLRSVAELANENPIDWLSQPPPGYLGVLADPDPDAVPPGSWYFDIRNNELAYRPKRTRYFVPNPDSKGLIHFKSVIRIKPASVGRPPEISELDIRPTAPIRWEPRF